MQLLLIVADHRLIHSWLRSINSPDRRCNSSKKTSEARQYILVTSASLCTDLKVIATNEQTPVSLWSSLKICQSLFVLIRRRNFFLVTPRGKIWNLGGGLLTRDQTTATITKTDYIQQCLCYTLNKKIETWKGSVNQKQSKPPVYNDFRSLFCGYFFSSLSRARPGLRVYIRQRDHWHTSEAEIKQDVGSDSANTNLRCSCVSWCSTLL